jgi:UDP-N-acetylglucosamine 2-epimerase (non-hydrolysing)
VIVVVGTRPDLIKLSPLVRSMKKHGRAPTVVHTGQHYDDALDGQFARDLGVGIDHRLDVPREGTVGTKFARTLDAMAGFLSTQERGPVMVQGDTMSSLACALAAASHRCPLIHLEAGLRSGDLTMPEEVARIQMDALARLLLCPTEGAAANLRNEGVRGRIEVVGNTIVDALASAPVDDGVFSRLSKTADEALTPFTMAPGKYVLMTLHRPENTGDPLRVNKLIELLQVLRVAGVPVIWPVHPRSSVLADLVARECDHVRVVPPQDYASFQALLKFALLVVTDSGGVQEEAFVRRVPAITLRRNTERPETLGKPNVLVDAAVWTLHSFGKLVRERVASSREWDHAYGEQVSERIMGLLEDGGWL